MRRLLVLSALAVAASFTGQAAHAQGNPCARAWVTSSLVPTVDSQEFCVTSDWNDVYGWCTHADAGRTPEADAYVFVCYPMP